MSDLSSAKRRRIRLQFSLATLLVLLTCLGIWLGWLSRSVKRQREALAAIETQPGWVWYAHHEAAKSREAPVPGPAWLRQLLGDDYFRTPLKVLMQDGATDALLAEFPKLPYLDDVWINGSFTGQGLGRL